MSNEKAVATKDHEKFSLASAREQMKLLQELKKDILQGPSDEHPNGVHYGRIPGCGDKDVLLKPGAEKMCLVFGLRLIINPQTDMTITEFENRHREYRIISHLINKDGVEVATGVGSASTLESKYAYRTEYLGEGPRDYKERKAEYKTMGLGFKKVDGKWVWCNFRVINPNIADTWNTVLKIAKKRSHVDATITATASGDFFTQDLDDMSGLPERAEEAEVIKDEPKLDTKPETKPEAKPEQKAEPKKAEKKAAPASLSVLDWTAIDKMEVGKNNKTGKPVMKLVFGDLTMFCEDETKHVGLEKAFNEGKKIKGQFDNTGKYMRLVDFRLEEK